MPELPDVEILKRYFESHALHKSVESVDVDEASLIENLSAKKLKSRLKGQTLRSAGRHGKYLLVETSEGDCLVFHFGMTGNLKYYKEEDDAPERWQVRFNFSDGGHLAYQCVRKLGEIELVDDKDQLLKDKDLGPDALQVKEDAFVEELASHQATVKSILMNQKVVAGIGNVYADEILYQAHIHPERRTDELDEKERRRIYRQMMRVFRMSIDRDGDPNEYPRTWLIRHRDEGEDCPRCDSKIQKTQVSGRSTYYCPDCQPHG